MKIEFDPAKSEMNAGMRGLPFELVEQFDFDSAWTAIDGRKDYGEVRYRAIGALNNEIVAVVFTMRGKTVRVISLRLANRKERRDYEEENENRS
jgi:uncharacterized DUF497 family protein